MKNRILFILSLFFVSLGLSAENISVDAARKRAMDFFKSNSRSLSVNRLDMVYDGSGNVSRSSVQAPALYVFDNPDGKGFVIVAGDDIAYPILGYSFENDFPVENIPSHVAWWLKGVEDRINYGREKGYVAGPRVARAASDNVGNVVVKLTTAKWDQGYPYNKYIPKYNGQDCYVGCTATATAIIMEYHKHPTKGVGTLPSYSTDTHSITVPETPLGHTYSWDKMLSSYYGSYSDDNVNAVARLMADVAFGLQSDFTPTGTGALPSDIAPLLQNHFGYDKGAINYSRNYFSNVEWSQMIQEELDKDRPVLYSGFNNNSGHAFVLDGYTDNDYFSVNWGWSGYYNGYFLLDALEPSGSGSGGNNDHYNFYQGCVVGLIPDEGGDYIEKMSIGGTGISTTETNIQKNKAFQVVVNGLYNTGNCKFVGEIIYALVDKGENIKQILRNINITEADDLLPNWGWSNRRDNLTITENIEIGDRIRLYFRTDNIPDWTLIKGGEGCTWELLITDPQTISEATSLRFDKGEAKLVIETKNGVTVKLYSSGSKDYSSLCKTQGKVTTISTASLPADTYTIKLSDAYENVNLKIKLN